MYDSTKVIAGIIIFIATFTAPIWINYATGSDESLKPVLSYPADEKQCIMTKEYMNANHMDLLNQWRDEVVRSDSRYLYKDGKPFMLKGVHAEKSLTNTCMKCHDNKTDFCDKCHNYLDVKPYCWDCHVSPDDKAENFAKGGNNE